MKHLNVCLNLQSFICSLYRDFALSQEYNSFWFAAETPIGLVDMMIANLQIGAFCLLIYVRITFVGVIKSIKLLHDQALELL